MAGPYDVAIHLSAVNGVSGVLAVIGKDVLGLTGSVKTLQKELSALRVAAVGGMAALGGAAVLSGMTALVGKGNELIKVQRDMAQAGVEMTTVQRAYNEAWRLTGQYQNMSAVEVMKMLNDARQTLGDQEKAIHEIQPFVEAGSFLKAFEGGAHATKGEGLLREMNAALKSSEIAGKITPDEMHKHVQMLTAMKVAFGEQVKIGEYLTAQRAAGVALRNVDDQFRYGMFPALVQENGVNAGVMLMTAFNKVVAGVGNRTQSVEFMRKIGLLNDDQIDYDKAGRAKGLKDPDAIRGSRDAAFNFAGWVNTTLRPLIDNQAHGDQIKEAQIISKLFPDRNAAKAVTEMLQQFSKLSKDAANIYKVSRDFGAYTQGSWDYQVQAFRTQWDNFMQALGSPLVKTATSALAQINNVMSGISQWAAANPEAIRAVGIAVAGLAATLTTVGAVLLGTALAGAMGPMLSFAAGIGAVASAIAGVVSVFWPQIKGALAGMKSGLDSISVAGIERATLAIVTNLSSAIASIPGQVMGAISTMASAIASKINSALSSIASGIANFGKSLLPGFLGGGAKTEPAAPSGEKHSSVLPPARQKVAIELHNHSYLDGRKVAQSVTRHQVARFIHPTSVGGMDTRGMWAPPSADSVG